MLRSWRPLRNNKAPRWITHKCDHEFIKAFNSLNAKLNPICHLLALLGAHHILHVSRIRVKEYYNPLNAELNPICHLLALLGAHHILHVSIIRVKVHFNPLNAQLNPICHLLALLGAHHILHVSRIMVKWIYDLMIRRLLTNICNKSRNVIVTI